LRLEHESQEVAADGALSPDTVLRTDDHFRLEPEHFTVHRRTHNRRDVVAVGDEIARDDHIKARLVPAFGNPRACPVGLSPFHRLAWARTNARACCARRRRWRRTTAASRSSSARRSSRDTYSRTAWRIRRERFERL